MDAMSAVALPSNDAPGALALVCDECGEELCIIMRGDLLGNMVTWYEEHQARCAGPLGQGCPGCDAEPGERCRPMCLSMEG